MIDKHGRIDTKRARLTQKVRDFFSCKKLTKNVRLTRTVWDLHKIGKNDKKHRFDTKSVRLTQGLQY